MADISKCKGTDCKHKKLCYRYTVKDNEFRQSYMVNVPVKNPKTVNDCEMYWDNGKKDIK